MPERHHGVARTVFCRVALCSFLALTGCAHTDDVLAKEPEEVIHSKLSVDEISACFGKYGRVIERADGARVMRYRNGYGGVNRAFSIYPEPGGSRVEIRRGDFGPVGPWKRCVGLKSETRS